MIPLDCSYGEGGGQILRTALALSSLMKEPFDAFNIRYNRPTPGLKNQHMFGIKALQKLTKADVKGAEIGSEHVEFYPGILEGKTISVRNNSEYGLHEFKLALIFSRGGSGFI